LCFFNGTKCCFKFLNIIDEYDLTEIETNDIVIDYDSIKKEYTMEELMDLVKEEIDFKDLN
jgi:hypothetical protein